MTTAATADTGCIGGGERAPHAGHGWRPLIATIASSVWLHGSQSLRVVLSHSEPSYRGRRQPSLPGARLLAGVWTAAAASPHLCLDSVRWRLACWLSLDGGPQATGPLWWSSAFWLLAT